MSTPVERVGETLPDEGSALPPKRAGGRLGLARRAENADEHTTGPSLAAAPGRKWSLKKLVRPPIGSLPGGILYRVRKSIRIAIDAKYSRLRPLPSHKSTENSRRHVTLTLHSRSLSLPWACSCAPPAPVYHHDRAHVSRTAILRSAVAQPSPAQAPPRSVAPPTRLSQPYGSLF